MNNFLSFLIVLVRIAKWTQFLKKDMTHNYGSCRDANEGVMRF